MVYEGGEEGSGKIEEVVPVVKGRGNRGWMSGALILLAPRENGGQQMLFCNGDCSINQ